MWERQECVLGLRTERKALTQREKSLVRRVCFDHQWNASPLSEMCAQETQMTSDCWHVPRTAPGVRGRMASVWVLIESSNTLRHVSPWSWATHTIPVTRHIVCVCVYKLRFKCACDFVFHSCCYLSPLVSLLFFSCLALIYWVKGKKCVSGPKWPRYVDLIACKLQISFILRCRKGLTTNQAHIIYHQKCKSIFLHSF